MCVYIYKHIMVIHIVRERKTREGKRMGRVLTASNLILPACSVQLGTKMTAQRTQNKSEQVHN